MDCRRSNRVTIWVNRKSLLDFSPLWKRLYFGKRDLCEIQVPGPRRSARIVEKMPREIHMNVAWSQSYDRELQRQRCKFSHRHG
jgi:hypothetical protein